MVPQFGNHPYYTVLGPSHSPKPRQGTLGSMAKSRIAGGKTKGGFPKLGYLFRGPYNKDHSILGSILGFPNSGKLPNPGKDAF